jgi:hypothetical protein
MREAVPVNHVFIYIHKGERKRWISPRCTLITLLLIVPGSANNSDNVHVPAHHIGQVVTVCTQQG